MYNIPLHLVKALNMKVYINLNGSHYGLSVDRGDVLNEESGTQLLTSKIAKDVPESDWHKYICVTGYAGDGIATLLKKWEAIALKEQWMWVEVKFPQGMSINEETLQRSLEDTFLVLEKSEANIASFSKLLRIATSGDGNAIGSVMKELLEQPQTLPAYKKGMILVFNNADALMEHCEAYLIRTLEFYRMFMRMRMPIILAGRPNLTNSRSKFKGNWVRLDIPDEADCKRLICELAGEAGLQNWNNKGIIDEVISASKGYRFLTIEICRELFDLMRQGVIPNDSDAALIDQIAHKVRSLLFQPSWHKLAERQRDVLSIMADIVESAGALTTKEIVTRAGALPKPLGPSQTNQVLLTLIEDGLIFKPSYGKYTFAHPTYDIFIRKNREKRG